MQLLNIAVQINSASVVPYHDAGSYSVMAYL